MFLNVLQTYSTDRMLYKDSYYVIDKSQSIMVPKKDDANPSSTSASGGGDVIIKSPMGQN